MDNYDKKEKLRGTILDKVLDILEPMKVNDFKINLDEDIYSADIVLNKKKAKIVIECGISMWHWKWVVDEVTLKFAKGNSIDFPIYDMSDKAYSRIYKVAYNIANYQGKLQKERTRKVKAVEEAKEK